MKSNLNKTAVQSLFERLKNDYGISFSDNVEKDFLEMEKEQVIKARFEAPMFSDDYEKEAETYYKETYE